MTSSDRYKKMLFNYRLTKAGFDITEGELWNVLLAVEPSDHHFIIGSPRNRREIMVSVR